jgi:hypothetical protein
MPTVARFDTRQRQRRLARPHQHHQVAGAGLDGVGRHLHAPHRLQAFVQRLDREQLKPFQVGDFEGADCAAKDATQEHEACKW